MSLLSRNSNDRETVGNRRALAGLAGLGLVLAAGPAAADIEPEAARLVRAMADYMGGLSAFSVEADVDNEVIDLAGQKLQLTSSAELLLQRPEWKIRVSDDGEEVVVTPISRDSASRRIVEEMMIVMAYHMNGSINMVTLFGRIIILKKFNITGFMILLIRRIMMN